MWCYDILYFYNTPGRYSESPSYQLRGFTLKPICYFSNLTRIVEWRRGESNPGVAYFNYVILYSFCWFLFCGLVQQLSHRYTFFYLFKLELILYYSAPGKLLRGLLTIKPQGFWYKIDCVYCKPFFNVKLMLQQAFLFLQKLHR